MRRRFLAALVIACVLGWRPPVSAQQLPRLTYGPADGLASRFVHRIRRDARGFLWFCTKDGLSRFDGHRFVSYSEDDGVPTHDVYDVVAAHDGTYWIGTNGGGVAQLLDRPSRDARGHLSLFGPVYNVGTGTLANRVNVMLEDHAGRIWAGSDTGVAVLDRRRADRFVDIRMPEGAQTWAMIEDPHHVVWIGTNHGLFGWTADDRLVHLDAAPFSDGSDKIRDLAIDRDGRLWIATRVGIFAGDSAQLAAAGTAPAAALGPLSKRYTTDDGLGYPWVESLYITQAGQVWAGTYAHTLHRLVDGRFVPVPLDDAKGISIQSIIEDPDGHVWLSTQVGATELALDGFTIYSTADGLANTPFRSIAEDQAGHIMVVNGAAEISRLEGARFRTVRADLPKDFAIPWASPGAYLDRDDGWWVLATRGTYRFHADAGFTRLRPTSPATFALDSIDGETPGVQTAFQTSSGDVWLGYSTLRSGRLAVWSPETQSLRVFTDADGLPSSFLASTFAEDASGTIWIGGLIGGLARYQHGRFTIWSPQDSGLMGMVTALLVDPQQRLWIGSTSRGLSRADVRGDQLQLTSFTTANRLSSNDVRCLTIDAAGKLYLGTGRGIDRLDPVTNEVTHHNPMAGLGGEFVMSAYRDRAGALWFGTLQNVVRYQPQPDLSPDLKMYVSGVSVAGSATAVPTLGAPEVTGLSLAPDQHDVAIDFFALGRGARGNVRYQYRLEESAETWIDVPERSIHFGALAPGGYRVEIRALVGDRVAVTQPAIVTFDVAAPFYLRWWFLSLTAVVIGAAAAGVYRVRVRRVVEIERMRTRIATDLHDDIGANLTQISILSELARQQGADPSGAAPALDRIATVARDSVDSMSDIVWAISARHDRLEDLASRIRRTAADVVEPRGIRLEFQAPDKLASVHLAAEFKRQVFLVAKEAVNNAARHARCTVVRVELKVVRGQLTLTVADNGRGLPAERSAMGHGLESMQLRAKAVSGTIAITSAPNEGTQIVLTAPLDAAWRPPAGTRGTAAT